MEAGPASRAERPSFARSCAAHCRDPAGMRRTVVIALVVGTLLTLVNQVDHLADDAGEPITWLRVLANYLIPWAVSSLGYVSARRAAQAR